LVESGFSEINACQVTIDAERNILYFTDTQGRRVGELGGGGYVLAFKADPATGKLSLFSRAESLAPEPEYICIDNTRRYAMVPHHTDPWHVTRIVKKEDGSFTSETLLDDAALVLFRLNEDGTYGSISDVVITRGDGPYPRPHAFSRQHAIYADPSGELFLMCDKGLDKIFSYHLDRANGKLVPMCETVVETGSSPRYGVFHPTLPLFYCNNEKQPIAHAFKYDVASGKLERVDTVSLLTDQKTPDGVTVETADIVLHPNAKYIYISIRGLDAVAMIELGVDGKMKLKQNISSGGKTPRSLSLSPDGRFLFVGNMDSNNIVQFAVGADGHLTATGQVTEANLPSCMKFLAV
jgi:6-phosphogluconolactonase (cycloisomerase 2 family)